MRLLTSLAVSLLICASAIGQATKRITVQLRHDDGRIVRVVVLSTSPAQDSLAFKEVLDKEGPKDLLTSAWYTAGAYRFDGAAFTNIFGGWSWEKYSQLKVADLRDGDVVIMHHPYP